MGIAVRHCLNQLEDVISDGALPFVIADKLHIGLLPDFFPRKRRFRQKFVKGFVFQFLAFFFDNFPGIAIPEGCDGNSFLPHPGHPLQKPGVDGCGNPFVRCLGFQAALSAEQITLGNLPMGYPGLCC